ncbi:unnamed protein product [Aphanomyces euteiches]|uniref:Cysteine/serine-rich nuclear protein N-terminal domain-containing protein n=1 Tax=Aphanomyces euteiches TaxID=100861 RepID=A0A6G0WXH6_9STRA|nr:hypothetical protein Ae201684_010650 [Aphanomyces euteiches]KAH9089974.1 hypothetical protein Ae201684P_014729 [Aphanomyces euteiches]
MERAADKDTPTDSPTHVEALIAMEVPLRPTRVHFSTATTYLFNPAYGGSALPKETGPPIGMAITHFDVVEQDLSTRPTCRRGSVRKFNHLERIEILKQAEYHVQEIASFCMDAIALRKSRQETVDEVRRERKRKQQQDSSRHTKPRMFHPSMMGCVGSDDEYDSQEDEDVYEFEEKEEDEEHCM